MNKLRSQLIGSMFLKEKHETVEYISEKETLFPKHYYTEKDYALFFKRTPVKDAENSIKVLNRENGEKYFLYASDIPKINHKRDNLKAVTFELSYSLSTQKKFKSFSNVLDIMIKGNEFLKHETDEYYKRLADGLLYGNSYNSNLQIELKTQMYALVGLEHQLPDSDEAIIREAHSIIRDIDKSLELSSIFYSSPYDIYQKKGVFGFTEEITASEEFHKIIENESKNILSEDTFLEPENILAEEDNFILNKKSFSEPFKKKEYREPFQTEKIGLKGKFKQNIQAIKLIALDKEFYTQEEKKILSKYTGFGGIPQAFAKRNGNITKGWEKEVAELVNLLSNNEYAEARRSTLTAFYTPSRVVKEIYTQVEPYFRDKKEIAILEPSVGTGIFIQNMPDTLFDKSKVDAIELNEMTYNIFSAIQKKNENIKSYNMSFLDFEAENGSYDLVVGNPPFSNVTSSIDEETYYLHEHFINKSMKLLKEDGIMAMVVSNSFLDSKSDFKEKLEKSTGAELVNAIRLPSSAFTEEAHTEVVTDIIFMKKNKNSENKLWLEHGSVNNIPINRYYTENEQNLMGKWELAGTMYQGDMPSLINKNFEWDKLHSDTSKLISPLEVIKKTSSIPNSLFDISLEVSSEESGNTSNTRPLQPNNKPIKKKITQVFIADDRDIDDIASDTRIGSLFIHKGTIYKRENDKNTHINYQKLHIPKNSKDDSLSETKISRLKPFIEMKDTLRKLISKQTDAKADDAEIEDLRLLLSIQYDEQIKKGNYLNKSSIKSLLKHDTQYPLLLALEKEYTKEVKKSESDRTGKPITKESSKKADIFFKRTQFPETLITKVANPIDALSVSMGEKGKVDIDYMSTLLDNYSKDELLEELLTKKLIYQNEIGNLETRDEFLSGDVKTKYENTKNTEYKKDLMEVIPKDINPYDIEISFGASWVDAKYIEDFVKKINNSAYVSAYYTKFNSQWTVNFEAIYLAQNKYGTERVKFEKILSNAINNKKIEVYDMDIETESRVLNKQATFLANSKAKMIKEEFSEWIFEDKDRRDTLAKKYNDLFNRVAIRKFDGSVLPFHGKVSDDIIKLRPHQKNAAYRMSIEGKLLFDHTVGTGKTFTLIAGLSELIRLGKITKPLVVVPNHKVTDWAKDWLVLYPSANILAPDKKDFQKENRQKLFSSIMTSNYDAIIIGHSQLTFLENDIAFESDLIIQEIEKIQIGIDQMREEEGKDSRSVKSAEKKQEKLEEKWAKLLDRKKDNFISFADLGIDYLAVDESHEFKNLPYVSNLTKIGGMGNPQGAQKAFDLYVKVKYIEEKLGKPNIAFLTGTPISNSVAEMYLLQRYLGEAELIRQGLDTFDAWVKQYAKIETTWQLSATGSYKAKDLLSTFQNMPELMLAYRSFADVVTNQDIKEILKQSSEELPIPEMEGGKQKNVIVEKSFAQSEYIGEEDPITKQFERGTLVWRSENLPTKPTKGADNMLVVINDAKKCALDMRTIDPSYSDDEDDTKGKALVREAIERYKMYSFVRGTQLIFCDLSTPKQDMAKIEKEIKILETRIQNSNNENEISNLEEALEEVLKEKIETQSSNFSIYSDLKEKLIAEGVPPKEIAFIHSYNKKEDKERLYNDVNTGNIRFLLGSTKKMGAGTNVQERLVGLHNLDAPWKPSDLEQREGRIIRQGNLIYDAFKAKSDNDSAKFKEVSEKLGINIDALDKGVSEIKDFKVLINRYATKGTLDSRMWEVLEQKAKFIEKLKQPTSSTERMVKNTDLESMSAGEMKALASDNPLILLNLQLSRKVEDLEQLKKGHLKGLVHIEDEISNFKYFIENGGTLISELEKDMKSVKDIKDNETKMSINNLVIHSDTTSTEIGNKILDDLRIFTKQSIENKSIGKFGAFELEVVEDKLYGFKSFVNIDLIGEYSHPYAIGINIYEQSAQGLYQKVNNMLNSVEKEFISVSEKIEQAKMFLPELQASLKPFKDEEELQESKKKLERVIRELVKPKNEQNHALFENKQGTFSLDDDETIEVEKDTTPESVLTQIKSKEEHVEDFLAKSISKGIVEKNITEKTIEKAFAYADLMGDEELKNDIEKGNDWSEIADYFSELNEGEYKDFNLYKEDKCIENLTN